MSSALRLLSLARPLRHSARTYARTFTASARAQEHYLDASQETFDKVTTATARNERVVLVDFYADWCGPCKMLSPVLEQLTADPTVASGSGRPLDLVTVNTDEQVALAAKFKVSSIPTVVAFKDGQPVSQFVGALNEPGVRRFLASI